MGHALGNNYGKFYSFQSKPVILDLNFVVDAANGNGLGVRSVKGQGVQNVFMHTSASAGRGPNGYLNPNPIAGIALIQLRYNYTRIYGGPRSLVSPLTGGNLAINASALTLGTPYVIVSVGHGEAGTATIAPVADTSGSLASTWFKMFDNYGNTFIIWFRVSGVGAAPQGVSGTLVQVDIVTGETAANVGAKLVIVLNTLLAATLQNPSAPAGVFSFAATGTTTVTAVSTQQSPYQPLPGVPADGTIATGFTFALTKYTSNNQDWLAVGVPPGVVPAVGVAFIATAVGYSTGGASTGLVKAIGTSGISSIESVGDANLSLAPIPVGGSANVGGWFIIQYLDAAGALAAPADGTTVGIQVLLEQATRVGGNNE